MTGATPTEIARASWGDDIPDWVMVLAKECATSSQTKVAALMNRSPALVSTVLRAKYAGDMSAVEEVVRGVFMNSTVRCPALGIISTAACRDWMARSRSFSNENSERVRMFKACRSCPRAQK
ncbi:hypothetical protein [Frigidibacter oleivorans]|uniref:hypothetical protein n=1 Tax=Frigidibacter oleivorans TaxID=2487129 RepID=UPI001F2164B6|nr:hypothetical protein [Frigidibacter oleivorans]